MGNNSFTVDVVEDDLVVTGFGPEQIRIPLSEAHNRLDIWRDLFGRTIVRVRCSNGRRIRTRCDADKAAELGAKLVRAWFAVPRVLPCKSNDFLSRIRKVEIGAGDFVLIKGDERVAVKPEYLERVSLGRTRREVKIPTVPTLTFRRDRQTTFWIRHYVEAWQQGLAGVFSPVGQGEESVAASAVGTLPWSIEGRDVVSHETIAAIQSLIKSSLLVAPALSLATWGAINLAVWYFSGQADRMKLQETGMPPNGMLHAVVYGGLAVSVALLIFAVISSIWRSSAGLLFHGVGLIGVGIWNCAYTLLLMIALGEAGHKADFKPGIFTTGWVVLGGLQCTWGGSQIRRFLRVSRWSPRQLTGPERTTLTSGLQAFVEAPVSLEDGTVSAVVEVEPSGFGDTGSKIRYAGKLLEDEAVLISSSLDDIVVVGRSSPSELKRFAFSPDSKHIVQAWLNAKQETAN